MAILFNSTDGLVKQKNRRIAYPQALAAFPGVDPAAVAADRVINRNGGFFLHRFNMKLIFALKR